MAIDANKSNSVPRQKPTDSPRYKAVAEAKPSDTSNAQDLTFKDFLTDSGKNPFRLTLLIARQTQSPFWASSAQFYKENMTGLMHTFSAEGKDKAEKIKQSIDKAIAEDKVRSLE